VLVPAATVLRAAGQLQFIYICRHRAIHSFPHSRYGPRRWRSSVALGFRFRNPHCWVLAFELQVECGHVENVKGLC
jgi:hypothetical protein